MSYILDALKKMEREKVKKTTTGGIANISGELYREERSRPSASGAWKIIVVAIVTACIAMVATWFYLKPHKESRMVARRSASPATVTQTALVPLVPAPQVPPKPSAPSPALQQSAQPILLPATPTKPAGQQTPASATPSRAADALVSRPAPLNMDSSRKTQVKSATQTPPAPRPATAKIAPPADIKVSGIAWQEERAARRAVINGFLMKEGGTVSGAKITEILQDKVRFSTANGVFELSMVAAGAQGATK